MRINKINIALILGLAVIVGIMILQFFLLKQAVHFEEKKFAQKVNVALLEVASKLNVENKTALPQTTPIQKVSKDYYITNVNCKFEEASLGYYLKNEFQKFDIETDYEYGFYDCSNETIKYSDYVFITKKKQATKMTFALAKNNMAYYFVVHFPKLNNYIFKSLYVWFIFSAVMFLVLVLYGYSAFTILQQKKYSELQRDFINNMTHEFKTPISSILIASNFLDKQKEIVEDEKSKKFTEIITQQALKLNGHVEKILNLAKTDNKTLKIEKVIINVYYTIQQVKENILLKYPNAVVNVIIPTEFVVNADEFHFTNIVYNVLDNAIKYAQKSPVVNIKCINYEKDSQLIFEDNGIGIPEKEHQHIFEKFYRVKNNSNNVNGFGLGLFYVKSICKEHKWKLQIKSEVNKGTTLTIIIPRK